MNILFSLLDHRSEVLLKLSNTIFEIYGHKPFFACDDSWVYKTIIKDNKFNSSNFIKFDFNSFSKELNLIDDKILIELQQIRIRDRYLKKLESTFTEKLLKSWYISAKSFLIKNNINVILIEGTPAFELVLELVAIELNIKIIVPDNLWKFKNWSVIYSRSNYSELYSAPLVMSSVFYSNFKDFDSISYKRVTYGKKVNKLYQFLNLLKNKPSRINGESYFQRFIKTVSSSINRICISYDSLPNSDFYVYFMHIEPEKTVDNVGFNLESQFSLIWHLATKIPLGKYLIVKEHPDNNGRLDIDTINKIKSIPGVLYVSKRESTLYLIKSALGVFTISGTISIEAQLYNNNVYVFGNGHFLKSDSIMKIENITNVSDYFLIESNKHEQLATNYILNLSKHAFNFEFSDCISLPSCLNDENIFRMANCINHVIENNSN